MEKPLETACVGLIVGWGRATGDHQGIANSVSQVDGVSYMAPTCWVCAGRAQKRNSGLCQDFCLRESCRPALALTPDNSIPPHIFLMPFNLVHWHWGSEGVSLGKSVHWLCKRSCFGFQQFLSSTDSIPAEFYSQKLRRLTFLALEPKAAGAGVGLGPLASEISLLAFIHHLWVCNQAVRSLQPPYQSQCGFFFNSVAVGLPFSSIYSGSER